MRELALFAGAGGGLLASRILGWQTVCAVELDEYCRDILVARQNDGSFGDDVFPIWDDVCTFDGYPWRGSVDLVSGGFPCQDISCAGTGAGLEGERSSLWSEFKRIIGEVRPLNVLVENSPMLATRGGVRVIADLAELGFDARWGVVGAHHAGAPHRRDRMWIVAHSIGEGLEGLAGDEHQPSEPGRLDKTQKRPTGEEGLRGRDRSLLEPRACDVADASLAGGDAAPGGSWWDTEPAVGRVVGRLADRLDKHGASQREGTPRLASGVPFRTDRLKAIGNGQVPAAAALAWNLLQ